MADKENSTSCSTCTDLKLNVQSVCCGTCDSYRTFLPSGEVAVMTYCSRRMEPKCAYECCSFHSAYTGNVPLARRTSVEGPSSRLYGCSELYKKTQSQHYKISYS